MEGEKEKVIVDYRQGQEWSKRWRKANPEKAKELDEIFNDKQKLKVFLEKKGFTFPKEQKKE